LVPTLLSDGDSIERTTWESLKDYFPHYEESWRLHVVPLRAQGSIHLRDAVDEDLQGFAMRHYSLYVNLARAYQKTGDPNMHRFFDEIYANLQRSRELAVDLVATFRSIHQKCMQKAAEVNDSALARMEGRLRDYRNLIHGPLLAYVKPENGRIRIPRPEHIEKYKLWTNVLYRSRPEEFEDVQTQLRNDFAALCSALEAVWKQMCQCSKILCGSASYMRMQQKGSEPPVVFVQARGASGRAFPTRSSTFKNKTNR
jgi:hypothetical protein